MFRCHRCLGLLAIAVGVAGGGRASRADLQTTQEMRIGKAVQDPSLPPMTVTTRSSRPGALREESTTQFGPFKTQSLHLTLCKEKKLYEIDPKLKIYTVSPLDEPVPAGQAGGGPAPAPAAPARDDTPPGTGKLIMTSSVQDLGEEVVADRKTNHYMISLHTQSSGCAGHGDNTMKMETWVAPGVREEFHCSRFVPPIPSSRPGPPSARSKCKIVPEMHGNFDALNAYNGIVMRERMYQGDSDKAMMEMQITAISTDKLDDSLFAVPDGFTQVSADEFHKQQSQATMQQMMGGHAPASDAGNGDAGNADNGNAGNAGNANNGNTGNAGNDNGDAPAPPQKKPKFPFNIPGL